MMDVMDAYLDGRNYRTNRIDGSMDYKERMHQIEEFINNPMSFVFTLSTRAGGLGLNLTSADTVIIYDSDWNPHQDMQVFAHCIPPPVALPCGAYTSLRCRCHRVNTIVDRYYKDITTGKLVQAMDRVHRIGQKKPVLVLRLCTSNSVEIKLLKRATSKLALERLVIKKGAFLGAEGEAEKPNAKVALSAQELLEVMQGDLRYKVLPLVLVLLRMERCQQ